MGTPQKTCSSLLKVTRRRFFLRFLLVATVEFDVDEVVLRIPRGIILSGLRLCTLLTISVREVAREQREKMEQMWSERETRERLQKTS